MNLSGFLKVTFFLKKKQKKEMIKREGKWSDKVFEIQHFHLWIDDLMKMMHNLLNSYL